MCIPQAEFQMQLMPMPMPPKTKNQLSPALKSCNKILAELLSPKHKDYAWPFYEPVDPLLFDYHAIIEKPMDLGTVKSKMDARIYKTASEFADDVQLMFANCYRYNPRNSIYVTKCNQLREVFETQFATIPPDPAGNAPYHRNIVKEEQDSSDSTSDEERATKIKSLEAQMDCLQKMIQKLKNDASKKRVASKKKDKAIAANAMAIKSGAIEYCAPKISDGKDPKNRQRKATGKLESIGQNLCVCQDVTFY